jgi:hypothetical protein
MRFVWCGLLLSLVLCACGPSSAQVKTARTSHYEVDASSVFEAAMGAAKEHGGIAEYDADRGLLRTNERWYYEDGSTATKSGDDIIIRDGAVLLSLMVEVKAEDGEAWPEVTPLALQHVSGSPQPRKLEPDDPALPAWVQDKIDALYLAIHARLKAHAIPPPTP